MAMKNVTYEVPKGNKEVLIDPPVSDIPYLVQKNRQKIQGYRFEVNNIPFQVLRDKTRDELLRRAVVYTEKIKSLIKSDKSELFSHVQNANMQDPLRQRKQDKLPGEGLVLDYDSIKDVPIIQTGHEPIFYHPGIWIKNHFIHHLSKKLNGIGVNMVVDNDACSMGFVYVPVLFMEAAIIQKAAFIKNKEKTAYEEIMFDDLAIISRFKEEVAALLRENYEKFRGKGSSDNHEKVIFESMLVSFECFMSHIMGYHRRGCIDMVELLTAARSAMEEKFFLDNLEIPISRMCDTDGFWHFLLHIISDAYRFARIYNEKLAEYRVIHKIRSNANPLPDLKIAENLIELPFWVWRAGGQRDKCYIISDDEAMTIKDRSDVIITLKKGDNVMKHISGLKTLMDNQIKIRPRAVTTTMFSRLFFSDIFIHGIGGAKYDTITDEIISEFFHVEPPDFTTISATLFLPFDIFDLNHNILQIMRHSLRDMNYNPERYASGEIQNDAVFMSKVKEKQRLLDAMSSGNKEKREWCFHQIKELNKSMVCKIHTRLLEKQREIDTTVRALAYNQVARFREYPVCIYPMETLKEYFLNVFS